MDLPVEVSCGQCIGCRLARSAQWATRCMHESMMHQESCFITLTYDNANLPTDWSLNKKHFQDFMKRLRKNSGSKMRYFHCGEYGETWKRPHYHALIFGYDFEDKVLWKMSGKDQETPIYTSLDLEKTWGSGFATIGAVTFESAAYCARYTLKKITGLAQEEHYQGRMPEYCTMSRRPGIGQAWLDKFQDDVYPHGYVVVNGKKLPAPKYYDIQYELAHESDFKALRGSRKRNAKKHSANNTKERLHVRHTIQLAKLEQLEKTL